MYAAGISFGVYTIVAVICFLFFGLARCVLQHYQLGVKTSSMLKDTQACSQTLQTLNFCLPQVNKPFCKVLCPKTVGGSPQQSCNTLCAMRLKVLSGQCTSFDA